MWALLFSLFAVELYLASELYPLAILLGTVVQLLVKISWSCQQVSVFELSRDYFLNFKLSSRWGRMVIYVTLNMASCWSISEVADLLGFDHITISRVNKATWYHSMKWIRMQKLWYQQVEIIDLSNQSMKVWSIFQSFSVPEMITLGGWYVFHVNVLVMSV